MFAFSFENSYKNLTTYAIIQKEKRRDTMTDTIVAISTALGVGAISIVRLSGTEAISIANKIFKEKDLTTVKSHTISYGHIYDNAEIIDEVLVSVMKSPKTFTTEDIVEINCHGGIIATNKVLELCIKNGARVADVEVQKLENSRKEPS